MELKPKPLKDESQELLGPVVGAFERGLAEDLVAVVLFGSRARGEATSASDWDLLVIARRLPSTPLQRNLLLKGFLPVEWRGAVSLLARTPAEIDTHLTSLMLDIALDGIVLHDPEGYAAQRLTALRRLIERRGLYREQAGKELVWRWEIFPGLDWVLEWEAPR